MMHEHREAARIATAAGALLVELREQLTTENAQDVRDQGDRRAHEFIVGELRSRFGEDAVLSEEGKDYPARLDARRVWIVDPLDGTREFGEAGRTDWAVHVAFWESGALVAGAVALPGAGLTLSTAEPPGVAPAADRIRLVVSRTRPPALSERLADILDAELVPMGSAGAKTMSIIRGDADVYAHGGGQYEWDSAAPVAVARSAGLHCSRLDGSPLEYNRSDPWLPDLLVCRPELAEKVLAAIGQA